jgi:hypothetical protein
MSHRFLRRRARMAAALLSGALAFALAPVAAQAACPSNPTSTAFAQFGDTAAYSLAPGGSFESGTAGWSLSRAAVVAGNESYNIVPGTHSLAVNGYGTAASPWICISSEYPTFRVFARELGGTTQPLTVSLRWVSVLGLNAETVVASLPSSSAWQPSPVMRLSKELPLWMPGSTLQVRLVFAPSGGSSWAVDDVLIDPYSR